MRKFSFLLVLGVALLCSCNPRTYFLLDSRGVYKSDEYGRHRELILEFHATHRVDSTKVITRSITND